MEQERFQDIMLEQMARVTQEITVLRLGLGELRQDVGGLRQDVGGLKQGQERLAQRIVVIERDMHDKFGVVFDFISAQTAFNNQVEERFDRLEGKVDRLEVKVDRLALETAHVRRIK